MSRGVKHAILLSGFNATVAELDEAKRKAKGVNASADPAPPAFDALPSGLAQLVLDGMPVGQRSEQFQHTASWLKELGWTARQIGMLLNQHPHGIAAKYKGRLHQEIKRCLSKTADVSHSRGHPAKVIPLHWHGDPDVQVERRWLVQDVVPESGKGPALRPMGHGKDICGA